MGTDRDGGERSISVVALSFLADNSAGADAVECVAAGLGARDICVARPSGLDGRCPSAVHDRRFAARVGFSSAGATRGTSGTAAVFGACNAKFQHHILCAVLDFDSSLHLK